MLKWLSENLKAIEGSNMYIRELATLIAVADQGSFLKAAKELYITPASVMNQMNKLEGIVGVKLIERTNQGATLTAAGRSFYQDAKQMILLDYIPCRITLPRKHRLAKKRRLAWSDLEGEIFMLIQRGDSPVLNQMRDDIIKNHPKIKIKDAPNKYDASVFNECDQTNCLMETLAGNQEMVFSQNSGNLNGFQPAYWASSAALLAS